MLFRSQAASGKSGRSIDRDPSGRRVVVPSPSPPPHAVVYQCSPFSPLRGVGGVWDMWYLRDGMGADFYNTTILAGKRDGNTRREKQSHRETSNTPTLRSVGRINWIAVSLLSCWHSQPKCGVAADSGCGRVGRWRAHTAHNLSLCTRPDASGCNLRCRLRYEPEARWKGGWRGAATDGRRWRGVPMPGTVRS